VIEDSIRSWKPQTFPRGRRLDGCFAGQSTAAGTILVPSVRVDEREGLLLVIAEIPGGERDELTVTLRGDVLCIVGERKSGGRRRRSGIRPGTQCLSRFTREIRLLQGVDRQGVEAVFENSILTVRLPVLAERTAAESETTTIQVQ